VCHIWLNVTHTNITEENNPCSGNEYICHHFHAKPLETFQCCGCEYTVASEIQDPVLPLTLFKRLGATRNKTRSYADMMQQQQGDGITNPTLVSTFTTVLVYIKDLLNGGKRNINTNNPHFLARIGLSDGR
jgi:hypothetical protein